MSRTLIIALVGSLALNVFAGGFILGRVLAPPPAAPSFAEVETGTGFGRRGPPRGGLEDPFRMMRFADVLPPESRTAFREAFRERLPDLRRGHGETRRLRAEFGLLVQAEEWDADAVAAKLDELDAAQKRQRDAFKAAYLEALGELSAQERQLLMEAASKRRLERRRRFRDRELAAPPPGE